MMINHRTQHWSLSPTQDPEDLNKEVFAKILILIYPYALKQGQTPRQQSTLLPILHQKSHLEFCQQTRGDSLLVLRSL